MPILNDHLQLQIIQEKCKVCQTQTVNKEADKAIECDICKEWVCFSCSGISEEIYNLSSKTECNLDFICKPCKEELPRIREIMSLKQKQIEIIADMKRESETNMKFREDQEKVNEDLKKRLTKMEKVMEDKKLDDEEFPPLQLLNAEKEKLNRVYLRQQKLDEEVKQQKQNLEDKVKQQKDEKEEEKRRDDKERNLIVYGVPEESEDETEQMKADFNTVKKLYSLKVELTAHDIIQIIRLGLKSDDQIRPIRLTFSSMQKRLEVLRRNKDLKLEDDKFEMCTSTFCTEHQKHKHIYVSTDKTRQQRDHEKKLRDELKVRKAAGEDNLIIRKEKIIKKSPPNHARWSDLVRNGF